MNNLKICDILEWAGTRNQHTNWSGPNARIRPTQSVASLWPLKVSLIVKIILVLATMALVVY